MPFFSTPDAKTVIQLSLVLMLVYFLLILVLPKLFARKIETLKDFFLAGRTLSAVPIALSFVASWFGAASTIGSVNAFHDEGISGLWKLIIPSIIACFIICFFFAKRVASLDAMSQPEAVEQHYGRPGRLLLSLVILASVTAFLGSQMIAAGQVMQGILGLDFAGSVVAVTAVVVTYSMMGGYFAVVVTDIGQFILFTLAVLILAWCCAAPALGLLHGDSPVLQAFHSAAKLQPPSFWSLDNHLGENLFLVLTFVTAWVIAPEMWQRASSAPSPKVAFRGILLASLILMTLYALVTATGLASIAYVGKSEHVLMELAFGLQPPLLSAIVIIGVMAAITSSMDSTTNVGSLTLTRDLYQGFIRPGASTRELLWVSRLGTVLVVIPAIFIALYFQDIIRVLWVSADIYASTMFFPIIGLLYVKNPGRWSGLLSMIFGALSVLVTSAHQYGWVTLPFAWPEWPYSTLIGIGMSGLGFCIGYYCLRKTLPERKSV